MSNSCFPAAVFIYRESKKEKNLKQKKPLPTKNCFYLSLFPGNMITFIYLEIDLSIFLWFFDVCVHVIT